MSFEAWRHEVANGTMADWDEDKDDYADAAPRNFAWCCYDRMVNNPPIEPHQHCSKGHPLQWYDKNDPERGYFDCDDESAGRDE